MGLLSPLPPESPYEGLYKRTLAAGEPVIRPLAPLTTGERLRMMSEHPVVRLCLCALVVAIIGGYYLASRNKSSPALSALIEKNEYESVPTSSTQAVQIYKVYVTGEVNSPGVVDVRADERLGDAIEKAGGITIQGDISLCALASFVADGQTIVIPTRGALSTQCAGSGSSQPSGQAQTGQLSGKINLNTATQAEIETLPGVGPTLGAAIISYREQHGGFSQVSDLKKVKGIGEGRFEDLKDLVAV